MSALDCYDCHELEQELKIARVINKSEYQRGREDAAQAVFDAIPPAPIMGSGEITQFRVEDIINAARGNSEQ